MNKRLSFSKKTKENSLFFVRWLAKEVFVVFVARFSLAEVKPLVYLRLCGSAQIKSTHGPLAFITQLSICTPCRETRKSAISNGRVSREKDLTC